MPNDSLDQDAVNLAKAIRQKESNGNFNARGGSGEFGAYQFTKGFWEENAGKFLGNPKSPLTPENQNKVAYSRIKELKDQGFGPDQIASMWNSGRPDAHLKNNVGVNSYGVRYDTPGYVKGVMQNYQQVKMQTPKAAPAMAAMQQPQQPKQSLMQKAAGVTDALFGGGTIGSALGTNIAKGNLGQGLQKLWVGRDLSPEEEALVAPGPTGKQVAADVARTALNFLPIGRATGALTSRLGAEGMKQGTSRLLSNTAVGAGSGYLFDAAESARQGGTALPTPGVGTYLGGGLGAAGAGLSSGARYLAKQTGQQRLEDMVSNYVTPSRVLKEQTRNIGTKEAPVTRTPLDVLREQKLTPEVVNSKTDTSKMVATLQQELERAAQQTRNTLKSSGLVVPFKKFQADIVAAVMKDETIRNLGQTDAALKQLGSILKSYRSSYGSNIPVTVIDDIRQTMNRNKWRPESHDIYRAIGDAARQIVYDAVPDQAVKKMLQREGELLGAIDLAESLNAKAVKSGLIGKHFETLVGALAGGGAGAMMGPLGMGGGALVGALATRKAGDIARGAYFKTPVANMARKVVNSLDSGTISPGDAVLKTPMGQRFEASVKSSIKNPKIGLSIEDVSQQGNGVLRPGQPPIGSSAVKRGEEFIPTEEIVARERFNIPALKKISFGGSDRDVYDLGDGNVLKVSKTVRGLTQNDYSSDYYAEGQGLIPATIEKGKNYVVKERAFPPDDNVKKMITELKKLDTVALVGRMGGFDKSQAERTKAYEIMEKYGYSGWDLANYDVLWGDIPAIRNWGTTKGGKPIMLDEGSLNGDLVLGDVRRTNEQGTGNLANPEFREIYSASRAAKKKFGDIDKKTMYAAAPLLVSPTIMNNKSSDKEGGPVNVTR